MSLPEAGGRQPEGSRPSGSWARVAIVVTWVLQYRQGFHEPLRDELAARGIDLVLVHGFPHGHWAEKGDAISIPWAHHVENRIFRVRGKELMWTPAREAINGADLVVVTQQSKQLFTYEVFRRHLVGRSRMAYWGHGRNLDERGRSKLGEWIKLQMSQRVHWWFCYTPMTAQIVRDLGFPEDRITVVQNAIDTRSLIRDAESITTAEVDALRAELDIDSDNVGLYVGGMYPLKRLEYLVAACELIRAKVPDFHVIFLGGGADRGIIDAAVARHDWMHAAGPTFGREKARYFALSKLMLMPGRVGLAILDTFALGTPVVTVADSVHAPEIDYLEPGTNGVMLPAGSSPADYAAEVVRLLRDDEELNHLVKGALVARDTYTIEEMARRFAGGIEQALLADNRAARPRT